LQTGRRFYRLWLEFEQLGLSAAPMAVLADDVEARSTLAAEFGIPPQRRLITAFRLGAAPSRKLGPKPRLPVAELLA
jgi:nitroreductase